MGRRGRKPRHTPETIAKAVEALGSQKAAAQVLGISPASVSTAMSRVEIDAPPSSVAPIEEIFARRARQYELKSGAGTSTTLIPIRVREDKPIGILLFGDPHLDDDGTDINLVRHHVGLCGDGIYGASIGDYQNNWVGRLTALYGRQSTTAVESWVLAEWFFSSVPWLFLISGNHDEWSNREAKLDPLRMLARTVKVLYRPHGCRIRLTVGGRDVFIHARHTFKGFSMWNPNHGQNRAARMRFADHVLVAGHTHTTGHQAIVDEETRRWVQLLLLGSYKKFDAYADENGLSDQNLCPACLLVIDPKAASEVGLVTPIWDIDRGVDYVRWLRNRA